MEKQEERRETFHYTYSADEQAEIREIREKYAPQKREETPMERLRRLDRSATRGAAVLSLIVGIVSALILGVGMCCTLVWADFFILGIVIGLVGILGVIAAYPIYTHAVRRKRARLAPEILRLTDDLMR